jgi:hypothetical protein
MSSIRIPSSASKKVASVAEICNVGKEDAFRVLQQVNMDEEVAIERFLSGKVDTWHEVGDKKRRPGGQPKNNTTASVSSNSFPKRKHQDKKGFQADSVQGRAQSDRPNGAPVDSESKGKPRRLAQQKPRSGAKSGKGPGEKRPSANTKAPERTIEQLAREPAETQQNSAGLAEAASQKPSAPTWADRLKPKKLSDERAGSVDRVPHSGATAQTPAESHSAGGFLPLEPRLSQGQSSSPVVTVSAQATAENTGPGRVANADNRTNASPVPKIATVASPFQKEEQHLSASFGSITVSGQALPNKTPEVSENTGQMSRPLEPSRSTPYEGAERATGSIQSVTNPVVSQNKPMSNDQSAKMSSTEAWSMMPNTGMVRGQSRDGMRLDNQQPGAEATANAPNEASNAPPFVTAPEQAQPPQQVPTQVNGVPPNYYSYYPYGMPGHVPSYGYQGYPYYQPYGGYAEGGYPPKSVPGMANQPLSYSTNPVELKAGSVPHAQQVPVNAGGSASGQVSNYGQSEVYYGGGGYPQQYSAVYGASAATNATNASGEQARNIRRSRNADFYPPGGNVSIGGGYGGGFGSYYGTSHQGTNSQPYGGVVYNTQGYGNQAFSGSGFAGQPYAAQPYGAQPYGGQQYPMWQGQRGAGSGAHSPFNGSSAGNAQGMLPGQQSNTYPSY